MKTASGPVERMDGSPSVGTRARALVVRHIHSAFAVHSCPPFPCPVSGTSSTHYPSEIASSFPLSLLVPSEAGTMASTGCPPAAPFFGFMGAASALVFSNLGAAYGTAKSGVGVSHMGVLRPELVMRCVLPVAMAGVLGYRVRPSLGAQLLVLPRVCPPRSGPHQWPQQPCCWYLRRHCW
ncbi:hypothetical protein BU14_2119s0001 [Porphyra umbilicalis]|uniref:V-type proton ATPase proteolipid subunit n=1 Tax=Porphyra umbilicalis TaxID=2786 RepID=A0A1X6NJW0_PORUM|nr:hypothetical protein BU14_2119s0001 [Porphyra umbilicalis]|eukprot:OSX68897.1 hypothetical protein BU14_2119s0001 [Porphyra umbilicalis]